MITTGDASRSHIGSSTTTIQGGRRIQSGMHKSVSRNGKILHHQRSCDDLKVKLPSLEPHHLTTVFNETVRKMEIASAIPFVIEHLDKFKNLLGSGLADQLVNHKVIIDSFKELKSSQERLINLINKHDTESKITKSEDDMTVIESKDDDDDDLQIPQESRFNDEKELFVLERSRSQMEMVQKNLDLVVKKMQFSCRNILRSFAQNQLAYNAILEDENVRMSEGSTSLVKHLRDLQLIYMKKFSITPGEQMEKRKAWKFFMEREEYNRNIISQLEDGVATAEDDKNKLISNENDKIFRLRETLEKLKDQHRENLTKETTTTDKQILTLKKNSESKITRLSEELREVESKYGVLVEMHYNEEAQLRKKKYKVEAELEGLIQNYDSEMTKRQIEIEEVRVVYMEEKAQLEMLEKKFKALEEEYNTVMEERRIVREKREAEERERQRLVKAVTVIQSIWRAYKVSKAIKAKKKKGGKGGNPGQKKKTKKG